MNKDVWIEHFNKMASTLAMDPAEPWMFWVTLGAAFVMLAWVFTRVGERLDVANVEGFSGFIAAAVGTAAMLAGMTAASIYLAPSLRVEPNLAFLVIMAAISSVVVSVPLLKFWTQARFFSTVAAWFIALAASVAILLCFSYGFGSFEAGKEKVKEGVERRSISDLLDYHKK